MLTLIRETNIEAVLRRFKREKVGHFLLECVLFERFRHRPSAACPKMADAKNKGRDIKLTFDDKSENMPRYRFDLQKAASFYR